MKHLRFLLALLLVFSILSASALAAFAAPSDEPFELTVDGQTFRIENGEATLIRVSMPLPGMLEIFSSVEGYPVTAIEGILGDFQATGLVIPGSVKVIGENAFSYCFDIRTLYIGEGVEEIGTGAFGLVNRMSHVTLPYSLKKMEDNAFGRSGTGGPTIYAGEGTVGAQYAAKFQHAFTKRESENGSIIGWYKNLFFELRPDGTAKLEGNCGPTDKTFPTHIEGYPVTELGDNVVTAQEDGYVILPPYLSKIAPRFSHYDSAVTIFYYPNSYTTAYFAEKTEYVSFSIFRVLPMYFSDVADDAWYYEPVNFAYYFSIFNGVDEAVFAPEESMTRAMMVTVLYRIDDEYANGESSPFVDVPEDAWYTEAVIWANERGIVEGIGDGKFDPDGLITREQLATILYRYTKTFADVDSEGSLDAFADTSAVADYAVAPMRWAVASKLIVGSLSGGETYLAPKDSATRAQVAAVLMRYLLEP